VAGSAVAGRDWQVVAGREWKKLAGKVVGGCGR
jgi:hypothetical protein